MEYLDSLFGQVLEVVADNHYWMSANLVLAMVPAAMAVALFVREHRRTAGWWLGVLAFGLLLPNAPYVVTDLVHLRHDAAMAESDGVLVAGVLPLYAAFVVAGYLAYVVAVELVVREVRSGHPSLARWRIEVPVHLACSVGIVLGRLARLNSWDTVMAPTRTAERAVSTLTWGGAPLAVGAVFLAVWLTHSAVRAIVRACWGATRTFA